MSFGGNLSDVVVAGGALLLLFLTWFCMRYDYGDMSIRKRAHRFPPSPPTNTIMGHRLPKKKCALCSFRIINRVIVMLMYQSFTAPF